MSKSKELTTNELYSMQRGQGGKFVSGQRIHNAELPVGFFQVNNTLILNYYDSSDKYLAALEKDKNEDLTLLLKKCLRGFDRAMYGENYTVSESLIDDSLLWLSKNKANVDCALQEFNDSPMAYSLKNLQSMIDVQAQVIIIALLTSYKINSKLFLRELNIFEHIDSLLTVGKSALRSYLFGASGLVNRNNKPTNNCHVIFSRLSDFIKNDEINESELATIAGMLDFSAFSVLKDIIDDMKLVSDGDFNNGCMDHIMESKSYIILPESQRRHVSSFFTYNDDNKPRNILRALIVMCKKISSINDMKEYLLSTVANNDENDRAETDKIVKTLLIDLDIT